MYDKATIKASVNDIMEQISSLVKVTLSKEFIFNNIKVEYDKGLESVERGNINLTRGDTALDTLQEYTFNNVKDMNEEIANKLRSSLVRGIMDGESTQQLTSRVREVMDVAKTRAQAIARTETHRAFNMGRFDGAKQLPGKKKKWLLVTEDERTSDICGAIHRKYGSESQSIPMEQPFEVVVKGKKISVQAPPIHVNCRTRLMIDITPSDEK